MKKTFNQLTVGDKFYRVYKNEMKYETEEVREVSSDEFQFGYSSDNKIPRFKESTAEHAAYSRYASDRNNYFYFVNEADAIRFCKAQMMKVLFAKIEHAKKAILEVQNFRYENHELLNHKWTEREISKMESELAY